MAGIHPKTLQDLEFPTVLQQVSARCRTEHGKALAIEIAPFTDEENIREQLGQTAEYLSSFVSENRIPPHSFEGIDKELQLLEIENTVLEVQGFKKISSICTNVTTLKKFFKKFKEYYPLLQAANEEIEENKEIPALVDAVIDRFGEVRDKASDKLFTLRREIQQVKGKIGQSFSSALNLYNGSDYLDDIRESVVENRRVLAVKACTEER